jgi:hypothetical protein
VTKSRTIDEFIADELVRREKAWLAGDYRAMVLAFMLCTDNDRPLPKWVADAVMEHLEAGYFGRKAAVGRGRKGNPAAWERDNTFPRHSLERGQDVVRHEGDPATQWPPGDVGGGLRHGVRDFGEVSCSRHGG